MYVINDMPKQISGTDRQALLETDTGTIGHFLDTGFADPEIRQMMPGSKVAGTAVTVRVPFPDSVIGHYALGQIRPGDILVIDRCGDQSVSCWGGTTSYAAAKTGLTALIIDGAGNDISQANEFGVPIWCRGVTPVTTKYRGLGGELNVTVSCGGVPVSPGDAILADENGILVIPPENLQAVINQARKFGELERQFIEMASKADTINYPELTGATAIVEAVMKGEPPPLGKGPCLKD